VSNEIAVPAPLIAIDPQTYVDQVYKPFRDRFDAMKAVASVSDYDEKTTAGMKAAVEKRGSMRTVRVDIEKTRKEFKAPLLDAGKLLDTRAKEITAEIEVIEAIHDGRIKAEEARKEAEKKARADAEKKRLDGIHDKIADLRAQAVAMLGKPATDIAAQREIVAAVEVSIDSYGELTGLAQLAKDDALAQLDQLHERQTAQEEQERKLEAERIEFQRQQDEAAERERLAAAERAETEARAKAVREAEEARLKAERAQADADRLARQQAEDTERARIQADIDRQRRELEEQQATARREEEERDQAERDRVAAAAKAEQDRIDAEARSEQQRLDDIAADAQRQREAEEQAIRDREEAEALRQADIKAERRPSDEHLIAVLLDAFQKLEPTREEVIAWIVSFDADFARMPRRNAA
jgi:colicin import membrane protein